MSFLPRGALKQIVQDALAETVPKLLAQIATIIIRNGFK